MRTIQVKPLTANSFSRYGAFADVLHPAGERLGGPEAVFYPDLLRVLSGRGATGISVVYTPWRPMVADAAEQHDLATEVLLPLDGDIVCFVAPACAASFPPELAEAFLVPRGTAVALWPGVWHKAPFPAAKAPVSTLVILPERTYAVDCRVEELSGDKQLQLVLPEA